jgi:hypothetical protein
VEGGGRTGSTENGDAGVLTSRGRESALGGEERLAGGEHLECGKRWEGERGEGRIEEAGGNGDFRLLSRDGEKGCKRVLVHYSSHY